MRIVLAVGGNALLRRGEELTADNQARNVARAAQALTPVAAAHETILVHGNGPQVGLLALQDAAVPGQGNFPLDVLSAETSGMIGYPIAQALRNELADRRIANILTQVEVDAADPAFRAPTKPVGPVYDEAQARRLAADMGWTVAPDGDGWRRVVPSPRPLRILEIDTLRLLVDAGVLVLCAGGGGIPVVVGPWGEVRGVEAVIDKDASAALVAGQLEADALLLLTDVTAVQEAWGTPAARDLDEITVEAARAPGFGVGSIGPKLAAAADFVERTGGLAVIGHLEAAAEMLAGRAGTRVVAG